MARVRGPAVGSVVGGITLGAVAALFIAGLLSVAGGLLIIWDTLFRNGSPNGGVFRYMLVPAGAGLVIGVAIGGLIGFMRARRTPRVSEEMPVRPDGVE